MSTTDLSGSSISYQMSGLSINQLYTLSLSCVYDRTVYDCGTRFVSTRAPDLLFNGRVYTKIGVAMSWQNSLIECEAGGGTLVSLGGEGVEPAVTGAVDVSDIWTGTAGTLYLEYTGFIIFN